MMQVSPCSHQALCRLCFLKNIQEVSSTLTLFYTPYGWTAMHGLGRITQQNIMKKGKSDFLPTLLTFCLLFKKIVVLSIVFHCYNMSVFCKHSLDVWHISNHLS